MPQMWGERGGIGGFVAAASCSFTLESFQMRNEMSNEIVDAFSVAAESRRRWTSSPRHFPLIMPPVFTREGFAQPRSIKAKSSPSRMLEMRSSTGQTTKIAVETSRAQP